MWFFVIVHLEIVYISTVPFVQIRPDLPIGFSVVSIPANTVLVMLALEPVVRVVRSCKEWS